MQDNTGKFIVLYGINNLGKTTQAKMLAERLNLTGEKAEYLKYPVYNLTPSGKMLNDYLRGGNNYNLSAREAQIIYAINRFQYEPQLKEKIAAGINIIAEDYIGTGLAWGIGAGVDEYFLKKINSSLLKEDLTFLFDGQRFRQAEEINHRHENDDDLTNKVRWAHLKLAQEMGWIKINANLSIDEIHEQLWQKVSKLISAPAISAPELKIKVERLCPKAKLPQKAYEDDAGLDLFSADYYSLLPGEKINIKTGIRMAIPSGFVGLIWDKSGVAKAGIHTMAGVIDSGYRGEIMVNVINLSGDIYNIAPGQKIAQILIQPIARTEIIETRIEDETERNDGGFGSSGLF